MSVRAAAMPASSPSASPFDRPSDLAGYVVVIPTPVLAQVHRGDRDRASIDRVVKAVDALLPTSEQIARRAGELQAKTSTSDVVDAIVAAEALASVPALILTTDPNDLSLLLDGEPEATRVSLVRV
jgi:predicted nucleic acid-binding protein